MNPLKDVARVSSWVSDTAKRHTPSFMVLISMIYYFQGLRGYTDVSCLYLFKDKLKASPAAIQTLLAVGKQPWNFKFLYGMLSDNLPIYRKHVKYYIIMSGICGVIGYFGLASQNYSNSSAYFYGAAFLVLINLGGAFSDVLVDALVVKNSREQEEGSSALQSWCWSMLSIGGICGTLFGSIIVGKADSIVLFYLMMFMPLLVVIVGFRLYEPDSSFVFDLSSLKRQVKAVLITLKSSVVLKPLLWIFLSNAISPNLSSGMTYFRNSIGLDAIALGLIDTVAYFGLFLGTAMYAKYFTKTSYRKIFLAVQLIGTAFSALDLIQLFRINVRIGISDIVFVFTSDSILEILSRLQTMPFLVFCAQVCPEFIEATLFATLMSISNLSMDFSSLIGAGIMHYYSITTEDFDNLWICVVWRTILTFIPCLFVFMVPDTSDVQPENSFGFERIDGELELGGDIPLEEKLSPPVSDDYEDDRAATSSRASQRLEHVHHVSHLEL